MALREANTRMNEFLSIASHELRNPMATIKGNIQLARRRLDTFIEQASIFLVIIGPEQVEFCWLWNARINRLMFKRSADRGSY